MPNAGLYRLAPPECPRDWQAFHGIRRDAFDFLQEEEVADQSFCTPLLLWLEDHPIGAVQVDCLGNDAAALRLVAIDPAFQARGHGRALLDHAEAFVKGMGLRKAVVYATQEAAGFYSHAGYTEDEWDDTCLSGVVQMLKTLD
jgi:N-acetylglutamate synthase-like GNAT family acetyltransferase